jgi:hypothetical protein
MDQKPLTTPRKMVKAGPVSTSTKQIAGYTTVSGILNETGRKEHEYPEFGEKELMENGYDFLQEFYPIENGNDKTTRKITIRVKIEQIPSVIKSLPEPVTQFSPAKVITHIIRIAVRNSNVDNIAVFENLEKVFDYNNLYTSKRNQFKATTER